ncbi:MAG: type II secretion system F family protein [Hydrogenoanaerobacterium sp.]
MPIYKYIAKSIPGKTIHGTLNVHDEDELQKTLSEQNLFLLMSQEVKKSENGTRLRPLEISDFCRQIGTMLSSGVSLVRSVDIILQRDLPPRARLAYMALFRNLQKGISLSEAMREQAGVFPELLINMIYAGESSGQLDKVTLKMADHYEKEHRLNSKVGNAMIYPIILLCVTTLVMLGVFTLILPQFFVMFKDMVLPFPTRIMLAISNGIIDHWFAILMIVLTIIGVVALLLKNDKVVIQLDKMKLSLPKIGKLLKIIYTARFSRTLSSLYSSGLSMMNALEISRSTMGNRYIDVQFDKVIEQVRIGTPLSHTIHNVNGFDGKLASSIMVGEETGKLDDMLNSVADSFDYDSEMAIQRLTAFIEPVLIVSMAVIIGFIMISVMLPIFQMYQNIG